jgi:multidrug/hemolysin transport system ATP-binding protein
MNKKILEVSGLRKSYGSYEAVKGLNFSLDTGSLFAFLGQNGAGKSTTIKVILGLLKADSGRIDYDCPAEFRRQIGVVFQDNVFDEALTVEENLLLYGRLYLGKAQAVKTRYREIARLLDVEAFAKQRFASLSGGQKRKAEIARALFNSPRLLFLDEPTTGLDPKTRTEVWRILHELQKQSGMTVFLTTHYMEETADADKVVIIHQGRKVCEGSPAELKAEYSHDKLLLTPADPEHLETQLTGRSLEFTKTADSYAVKMTGAAASIELLYTLKDNLRFYEAVKGSMDDVFLNAVGENLGAVAPAGATVHSSPAII